MGADASLAGERVRLRPAEAADLVDVHRLWTMPEVRRFLFDDRVLSQRQVAEHVRESMTSFAAHGYGIWLAHVDTEPAPSGFAGLRRPAGGGPPNLLVGFAPSRWGRGLAQEATALVLDYAFSVLRLDEVAADADEANLASRRLLEKVGFTFTSRGLVGGRPLVCFRLRACEWGGTARGRAGRVARSR